VTNRLPESVDGAVDTMSDMPKRFVNLRVIGNRCASGACPTIYESDPAGESDTPTVLVQGFAVSPRDAGIDLPQGELLVEIPRSLLEEAARNLS